VLEKADRRAYRSTARSRRRARAAAHPAGELDAFDDHLTHLCEQHRKRRTVIAILDKANLR
jgi:hypothetical protein